MANSVHAVPALQILDADAAARHVAREIAELVRAKRARGERAVLGLATGRTPIGVYRELARLHRDEGLSFAGVTTFNLDEYVGLAADDPRSFRAWMQRELFDHVDFEPGSTHVPSGRGDAAALDRECVHYRELLRASGGLDYQLLGLGRNGHVAFNEPGATRESRMRVVELAAETRADAAAEFGGLANVPTQALTLGIADVLAARAIRLLVFGAGKRGILAGARTAPIGPELPATFLREHPNVGWIADRAAAGQSR